MLTGNNNEEKIWNYLVSVGLTQQGAAGLMGNMFAESCLKPNNLQDSFEKKLGMTDEQYTKAVDNGSYTNFEKDSAGYGLVQWTFWSLKRDLLAYSKSVKKSIGDLEMQLVFLNKELKDEFGTVYKTLTTSTSVKECSDAVLTGFERPSDMSDAVKNQRASYGQKYYDKYAKKSTRDNMICIAIGEIGTSAPDGDDKYIKWFNENVNKTWSFEYNVPWCHIFATYVASAAGLKESDFPFTADCDTGMNWFKNRKKWMLAKAYGGSYSPKMGDIIYYSSSHSQADSTHVGFVESYDGSIIIAVEGNANNAVGRRTIYATDAYILGYGIISFADEGSVSPAVSPASGSGICTAVALDTMYVRAGAGTQYNSMGVIKKDSSVEVLEILTNGWLKVVWALSESGFGYVSNTKPYFKLVMNADKPYQPIKESYSVGDIVKFEGGTHYKSATASKGTAAKAGEATITQIYYNGKHMFHLVATNGSTSNVHGWVDDGTFTLESLGGYKCWVGKVTAKVLNVRVGAGVEYGKLPAWPQLGIDNLIDVLGEAKAKDGATWYYVNIQGNKGYVNASYIKRA